jgi:hypothetical protein
MIKSSALAILFTFFSLQVNAELTNDVETKGDFSCRLFIQKNTCWDNYVITTEIVDVNASEDKKSLGKLVVDKEHAYNSLTFDCKKGGLLSFRSSFEPPIFKEQQGKQFLTKKLWMVPFKIPKDSEAWVVELCFPDDFQKVPMPLGEVKNCKCAHSGISSAEKKQDKKITKKNNAPTKTDVKTNLGK